MKTFAKVYRVLESMEVKFLDLLTVHILVMITFTNFCTICRAADRCRLFPCSTNNAVLQF